MLVAPRVRPFASLKRTKMRLAAGSKLTGPLPVTKMPNVGVALAAMWLVTVPARGPRQTPVAGSVWQRSRATGTSTPAVSADTVMAPARPTFTVATANTPNPLSPERVTIPSLFVVAARATMSGTGADDGGDE